MPGNLISTDP